MGLLCVGPCSATESNTAPLCPARNPHTYTDTYTYTCIHTQVQGTNPFFGNWTETRHIGTPDVRDDTYRSTEDFYIQHPHEWWSGGGPDHGFGWTQGTRRSEISNGDQYFSPFMSAGWSGHAEANVRPAQWLGVLKLQAAWQAEWFYGGFFSLRSPFPPSENWCWQAMMPSYAQATMTQWADFFYEGQLVYNDANTTCGKPTHACTAV